MDPLKSMTRVEVPLLSDKFSQLLFTICTAVVILPVIFACTRFSQWIQKRRGQLALGKTNNRKRAQSPVRAGETDYETMADINSEVFNKPIKSTSDQTASQKRTTSSATGQEKNG
ncbi:hypothetical protein M514_07202 [Trichuris suis]|uniref:Uncharacterized protein n=1 Tax=Trichuris suis TaxID=68888 RepID=A0A085M3S7_9BILA|nr:hypothetical protein M513_07202 [Trichuris suis]KFD67014.1 hypothetical protein M514_07202 [Trichuris suis]